MNSLQPDFSSTPGHGRAALLGMALTPVAVWCAMLGYDRLDPMCGSGGEGGIACATRLS